MRQQDTHELGSNFFDCHDEKASHALILFFCSTLPVCVVRYILRRMYSVATGQHLHLFTGIPKDVCEESARTLGVLDVVGIALLTLRLLV